MRIVREESKSITYDMREIVSKILQVLKEDQSLSFGPRLKSSTASKKNLQETISSKKQLLKKSQETFSELNEQLLELKQKNDNLREELLEGLGSEL
jgi:septal ring factor EnvC (AmiA/AmiB activator)